MGSLVSPTVRVATVSDPPLKADTAAEATAPTPNFVPTGAGQRMGSADFDLANVIPGHAPSYFAPIGRAIATNDWSMPLNGAFAAGEDWVHSKVPASVSNTIPYRATEVGLQASLMLADSFYFHRAAITAEATRFAFDPKLTSQPGPKNVMQQRMPLDAARLARTPGNSDSDEAAAYASSLWATKGDYHDAVGLLANRLVQSTHTSGASLVTTLLSPDTLFAAVSVGKYVVNGKTDARPPLMTDGALKLSYPSLDYYNTATGPYVQARVFVNPRATMVPVITAGTTLGAPGLRVGAALWRAPLIHHRLYVTPQAAVDLQPGGVGFSAGMGVDLRIVGKLGVTAMIGYAHKDIVENDVRNQTSGMQSNFGLRYGF